MIIPGLTAADSSMIIHVFSNCEKVDKAILYGSRAIGNFKPGSDIDISLVGPNLNLQLLNNLTAIFAELPIPYTLDISIQHQISNPELLNHIKRIGIPIYIKNHQIE